MIVVWASMLGVGAVAAENSARISWREAEGHRVAALTIPATGKDGFERLAPAMTGIVFSNRLSDLSVARNRVLEIGAGVALGDVDGDGQVDVYLCGSEGANVLYRNLGGWKFEDVTARAGVACDGQFSTGAVLTDLDGDQDLDLLVTSIGGGTRLFRNHGNGAFAEDTDAGLFRAMGATSMALADLDGDSDLDLYVTNYRSDTFYDHPQGLRMELRPQEDGSRAVEPRDRFVTLPTRDGVPFVIERGETDVLYLNRGGGKFVAVPWQVGLFVDEDGRPLSEAPRDWGLAVTFRDLNGDGLPDLYVCNDFVYWPDRMWLNDGGKRFRAAPRSALRSVSLSSMAVDVADINRDGLDDLFVADMMNPSRSRRAVQRPDLLQGKVQWPKEDPAFRPEIPRNTLQLARGDGTYAEIALYAGVAAADWAPAAAFLDVDLDGWEDLLVTAGNKHDVQDADALAAIGRDLSATTAEARLRNLRRLPDRGAPAKAFRNRRDLTFEDVSKAWGFDDVGVAQGFALGDLDGDGDLDVVVNAQNEPARVYRNISTSPRVAVRLRGLGENPRGIGARIVVRGGPVQQSQEMMAGGRFCSADDPMRVFAVGSATSLEVEVRWRSGRRSHIRDVRPNQVLEVFEPDDAGSAAGIPTEENERRQTGKVPRGGWPLFEDVSARLRHVHVDTEFDDFASRPLLPRRLSRLGPGLAWADLDEDGNDDLAIGGGRNGRPALYRNLGGGNFEAWTNTALPMANSRDQAGVLALRDEESGARWVVAESNWEDGNTNAEPFRVLPLAASGSAARWNAPSKTSTASGPLAMADVDGDGRLDLFVGGRAHTLAYPRGAISTWYRGTKEGFVLGEPLPEVGMVSGAVFSDFDGDGDSDLILACEWGPPRILRRDGDRWMDATAELGLERYAGGWTGIAAGDFDADGRPDFVLSNWGRNWRTDVLPDSKTPVVVFHGDLAGDGRIHTVLASEDPVLGYLTPWRDRRAMAEVLPSVIARYPTYAAYGRASVDEVMGDALARMQRVELGVWEAVVMFGRDRGFEVRPLPAEAQFASATGVSVADFDGDGRDDVFLAQNFFGTDAETTRQDAGTGLVLLGDGSGGFRSLNPAESGIFISGEARGTAVADFDGDGCVDLAVGVHRGATRLFRNRSTARGVRVRLHGGGLNPRAVGASVRLKVGEVWGPLKEVRMGTGLSSQDSATLFFGVPREPVAIRIRWAGEREWGQEIPWPQGAREFERRRSR